MALVKLLTDETGAHALVAVGHCLLFRFVICLFILNIQILLQGAWSCCISSFVVGIVHHLTLLLEVTWLFH